MKWKWALESYPNTHFGNKKSEKQQESANPGKGIYR